MDRILFIGHEASRSGAPFVLLHLLRWLKANRSELDFQLLLLTGGELESEYEKICTVHVLHRSISDTDANATPKKAVRYLRKIFGAEERLIAHLAHGNEVVLGNTVASLEMLGRFRLRGLTTLCWMHEMDSALDQFFTRERFAKLTQAVDQFIVGSRAVCDTLLHRGIEKPIDVVYEFIDTTESIEKTNTDIRRDLNIPHDAFMVGACASIERRKGIDLFLQIAERTFTKDRNIYFIWVGGRNDRTEAAYQDARLRLATVGIEKQVLFVDPRVALREYYRAMDVFLLPSREDPFPLVCLEAANTGRPILCFENAGGMAEFVEGDAGFAVPHFDIDLMTERIIELYDNADLRQCLGDRAAAKVRERNDVSKGAPEILKVIETAARNRK